MLVTIMSLLLVSTPSVARRSHTHKIQALLEQRNESSMLDNDYVPNEEAGPALPIPDEAYGAPCPFHQWYPEIPEDFGKWEGLFLDNFKENYLLQGSPVGIRLNDHNYNTPLGQGNTLGFVTAKLELGEGPDFTKYGLFAESGTLDAVLRFSDFGDDTSTNRLTRIALKLPLKTAWGNEVNLLFTETLDTFPIKNYYQLDHFAQGTSISSLSSVASVAYSLGLLRGGYFQVKTSAKLEALAKHFYSQLPYMLGDNQAMKFMLVPKQKSCGKHGDDQKCCLPQASIPTNETEARQFAKRRAFAIAKFLSECDAVFELQLQVRDRGERNDEHILHCASCRWSETPVKVGTLTIPKQHCDSDTGVGTVLREKLADILNVEPEGVDKMFTFHPIATHEDNRPLGDISTFRAAFYSQHASARFSTFEKGVLNRKNGTSLTRAEYMPFDDLKQAGAFPELLEGNESKKGEHGEAFKCPAECLQCCRKNKKWSFIMQRQDKTKFKCIIPEESADGFRLIGRKCDVAEVRNSNTNQAKVECTFTQAEQNRRMYDDVSVCYSKTYYSWGDK